MNAPHRAAIPHSPFIHFPLLVLAALALLGPALPGCKKDDPAAEQKTLNVYIWADYLPDSVVQDFTAKTGIKVNVATFASNEELQAKLQSGVADYDVICPSDYMVQRLIRAKLVQPLDRSKLTNFGNLDTKLLDQKFDPGNAYSVPYFWGTTGLGYNKKTLGEIDSWAAVFDAKHKGKVLMLEDARECMAVALRTMGKSANETDPQLLRQATDKLKQQKSNLACIYDSEAFHEKLQAGDVMLAQGYGGQMAKAVAEKPDELAYVIPKEGGTAWSDNLCIRAGSRRTEAAHQFINYVLDAQVAAKIANEMSYATPNAAAKAHIAKEQLDNPIIYPPADVMARCKFIEDVPPETAKLLNELWSEVQATTTD